MTSQPFLPCPLPRRKTGEDRMRWRAALSRACLLALLCGCGTIAGQAMAQTARQATAAAFDLGASEWHPDHHDANTNTGIVLTG